MIKYKLSGLIKKYLFNDNPQYNTVMTYLNFLLGAFCVILITYVSKVCLCFDIDISDGPTEQLPPSSYP